MLPFFKTLLFTCLTTLALALPTAAATHPLPGAVNVTSLEVDLKGGGCRPGEVGVALAQDNSAMTIIFDNFQAADGPKAIDTSKRASCTVNIGVDSPGWAFDVLSADFRGYVYLETGVEASLISQWKWNGGKGKGTIQKIANGPFEEDFLLHKDGELSDSEASDCQKKNAKLRISLIATVKAGGSRANGLVRGDSLDGGFGQILNISWKKC